MTYTHVVSWEIANGQRVPKGMLVRHTCDNPPCVNPAHLQLGTHAQNSADMVARRRHYFGENAPWAKLTEEGVAAIHLMKINGFTQQQTADKFGVSRSLVGLILQGKRWPYHAVART